MSLHPSCRRACVHGFFLLAAITLMSGVTVAAPEGTAEALAQLQTPGRIRVAVYRDFPPYSSAGEGIDVDIAKALPLTYAISLALVVMGGIVLFADLIEPVTLGG